MQNELIAIDKNQSMEKGQRKWEWLQKRTGKKKKKVHVTEGKHKLEDLRLHPFMTILTSSAKETRKRKEVSFTVDLSIRDPLQLQQEVLRPVLHIQGGRCCIWKQIPNILLSPTERETLRGRTERKRWVNHLYLLPSQSIWPRLQSRKSWLEKPSSQFCVPLVEKQREVGGGEWWGELQSGQRAAGRKTLKLKVQFQYRGENNQHRSNVLQLSG